MHAAPPSRTTYAGLCLFVIGLLLIGFFPRPGALATAGGLFVTLCAGTGEGWRKLLRHGYRPSSSLESELQ